MRYYKAFLKKDCMEVVRTYKLYIFLIIMFLFAIMNPGIAKLTPWIMEQFADTFAEQGLIIGEIKVDAMASWEQFYKNVPMALIAFVLLFSGIFANEYQRGTLTLAISKGASKRAVLFSKLTVLVGTWTLGFAMCYLVTYTYNDIYWDNAIANHCTYAAMLYWVFGLNIISFFTMIASMSESFGGALIGTGAYALVMYLVGIVPKVGKYLPLKLSEGLALLKGISNLGEYNYALMVSIVLSVIFITLSSLAIGRKQF